VGRCPRISYSSCVCVCLCVCVLSTLLVWMCVSVSVSVSVSVPFVCLLARVCACVCEWVTTHTHTHTHTWAGLPLVTFPVRKMASRAATSFVYASAGQGRATLVRTMKDMVNTSVRLGRKRRIARQLRRELEKGRLESPMFDTKRCLVCLRGRETGRMRGEGGWEEVRGGGREGGREGGKREGRKREERRAAHRHACVHLKPTP
jgi:hypothetical protein